MDRIGRPRIGMRTRARLTLALAVIAASGLTTPSRAVVPYQGWTPASFGLVSECGRDDTPYGYSVPGCFRTQRLRFSPLLPNVAILGTLRTGPWITNDGMTWAPLAPHCVTLKATQYTVGNITSSTLPCGIEDVAFDPIDPMTVYVSAFELSSILLRGTTFELGGVFKSTNLGISWTRIDHDVPGLAGSALTVIHTPGQAATILVGHFQHADHDTGAPWSLAASYDDGSTWRTIGFNECFNHPKSKACKSSVDPVTGCNRAVTEASSDLVAGLTSSPTNPNLVFAGTNGGLYFSRNRGRNWSLAFSRCFRYGKFSIGSTWAVTVSPDGKTVYAGVWDGSIWIASTSNPKSWSKLMTLPGTALANITVDAGDASGRTLLVAAMNSTNGPQGAAVYRVGTSPPSSVALTDSWAAGVNHQLGLVPHGPYELVKSAPSYWIAQSPVDSDVIYLSTTTSGLFWRSDGQALPLPGTTQSPSPPTINVPTIVPSALGVPSQVTVPAVPTRLPTATPTPTL